MKKTIMMLLMAVGFTMLCGFNYKPGETKVTVIGDSVTEGWTVHGKVNSWADNIGVSTNLGIAGTTVAAYYIQDAMVDRVNRVPLDSDIIIIAGGANDYKFNTPIGSYGDYNKKTFRGAYELLIKECKERCPNAEIICITPIPSLDTGMVNEIGVSWYTYANEVKAIAEMHGIRVINGSTAKELDFRPVWTTGMIDGYHPEAAEQAIYGQYVMNQLVAFNQ